MMKPGIPLVAVLAVALAAEGQQSLPKTPVFGSGVTLVAVPVFVTDKDGKAVGGLRAEDFTVEDGGKPAAIVSFQAIDVDDSQADTPYADELPVAVQAAAPRQFLILIDHLFSPRAGQTWAKNAAAQFIRTQLVRGDLAAVATIGPSGLRVLTNFSADHENVAKAVEGKGALGLGVDPLGLRGGLASPSLLGASVLGEGGLAVTANTGSSMDDELAFMEELQALADRQLMLTTVRGYVGELERLVDVLSRLRGRKQVVLLSAGFQSDVFFAQDALDIPGMVQALYRRARTADVLFHTVDTGGMKAPAEITSVGVDAPLSFDGSMNRSAGRDTLVAIAGGTGGRAVPPTGDFNVAFKEVDRISRRSYVIAFEAQEFGPKDTKPRSFKVKVKRAGVSVSHRQSYTAPSSAITNAGDVQRQAAEAITKGISGGRLGLYLTALPHQDDQGTQAIHTVLHVGGAALSEAAQGQQIAIQVYGYAMRGGAVLDSFAMNTSLDLAKFGKAVRESGLQFVAAFPVTPGDVDLRFFVRAGASNLTGSVQQSVTFPSFGPQNEQLFISKPMFMSSPEGQLVVPFQPEGRPRIEIPFYVDNERFIPDTPVILYQGRTHEVCVFVRHAAGASRERLDVTAEIAQRGNPPTPIRFDHTRVVRDADGFDRYVFTLRTPEAPAGSYTLRMVFRDPSTSMTAQSETMVAITR